MKVERGVENIKELIPFMNKVFNKHFASLLPKLYTSDKYVDNHYYIKDNGKLIGTMASIPNVLHVGRDILVTRGVGMVACHKKYRGQGVMSTMLKRVIADAKAEGVDYMFLSGDRQRYEHYGFVPCGIRHVFTLVPANFRHMKEEHNYTFKKLRDEHVKTLEKIYSSQDIYYERYDLVKVIKSWNIRNIYVIYNGDNELVGHIATKWGKIVDFATSEPQNTAYIVKAFTKIYTRFFGKIDLYPANYEAIESMAKYAQSSNIEQPAAFKILNFRHVIQVLLNMECRRHQVADFAISMVIDKVDSFSITCKDNVVTIGEYVKGLKTYTFNEEEATLNLFSTSKSIYNGLPFSLNIFVPLCDNV